MSTRDTRPRQVTTEATTHAPAGPAPVPVGWTPVCPLARVPREAGVAALVNGRAVALLRTHDDRVFALANLDPASGASVVARGIVGTRGERDVVVTPIYKHAYDLATGERLDGDGPALPAHVVRVVDGTVCVGPRW